MFSALIDFEVEVVRRLVENEHVRLLQHDAAEEQPGGLAARQRIGGFQPFFAAEEHLPEQSVNVLPRCVGIELMQPLDGGHPFLDRSRLILRKISDRDFVPPRELSRVEVDRRRGHARRVAQQRLQHRRLAGAVAADEHDFLAAVDDGVESGNDLQGRRRLSSGPSNSSATFPDGRFIVNLMYGRWMFERASSVVCSRSTSLRRAVAWLARVPAPKR